MKHVRVHQMVARKLALTILSIGVVAFVAGAYGAIGPEFSILFAGSGLLAMLLGAGVFLSETRPWRLSAPHPYVVGIAVAAAALHTCEQVYRSVGNPSFGFLIWAIVPYVLCLALSAFPNIRAPVIAGGAVALAFDLWGHYSVFINPEGSSAALALLFIPVWNTIIVVPIATFVAWSVSQRRMGSRGEAP